MKDTKVSSNRAKAKESNGSGAAFLRDVKFIYCYCVRGLKGKILSGLELRFFVRE